MCKKYGPSAHDCCKCIVLGAITKVNFERYRIEVATTCIGVARLRYPASSSVTVILRPSPAAMFTRASSEKREMRPRSRSLMRGWVGYVAALGGFRLSPPTLLDDGRDLLHERGAEAEVDCVFL